MACCHVCLGSGKLPKGKLGFAARDAHPVTVIVCWKCKGTGSV